MKIGVDARMYRSSVAGIGRYSQNLIKNLLEIDHENEYVLFMTAEDVKEFKSKAQNPNAKSNPKLKILIADIPHYSIAEQTKLAGIIAKEKCELVHFLNFNHPIKYKGKFVVTLHDLTLFFFPETAKETNFIKRLAFSKVMKSACKNSEKIISVSESTKKDIIDKFKVQNSKIKVIYEAADDREVLSLPAGKAGTNYEEIEEVKKKYQIGNMPVILYVGQFRPHKNLTGLVEAFEILRKEIPAKLVVVGKPDLAHVSFFRSIDKQGLKEHIVMPGFVSNNELAAWYKIAKVFVFPSFYEGFGLPGLEAMQAGTAVCSSNRTSLPEIYQDAACYFDPGNPSDIADKIKLVIKDEKLRSDLIQKGYEVAKKYSWQKTAQETLEIYKDVIHSIS